MDLLCPIWWLCFRFLHTKFVRMLAQFETCTTERGGVALNARVAGQGEPVVLLHGHPQNLFMWHRVAPLLLFQHRVVLMDLRGYGDSGRPASEDSHATYSKREMAADVLHLMQQLGHQRFHVLAHDRGARVAHRLAMDAPAAVRSLMLLDIAPTLAMYEQTSEAFARAYWHWFFLIQPSPLPEALIESDPGRYVRSVLGARHAGLAAFDADALRAYELAVARPGSAHAICEDYRASAGIDLIHDREDRQAGRRLQAPLHVLWAEFGAVGRCFEPLALWQAVARQVTGRALPCGHYLAEELPDQVAQDALNFFANHPIPY